ncbi:MAG: nucleotidyltransferase domain-containing protein [Deltaproteobacteria bacterium]|nr:nucleotidyltransferase domain-containing protein [Deltaproteobacteria bacterium]
MTAPASLSSRPANAQTVLALLPAAVRHRVEELVSEVTKVLEHRLVSIIVYGSAVRGGFAPQSDVDLLLIVDDDDVEVMRMLHDPLSTGRASARIDCRILKAREIPRAADVFPVFYDDVRACHAVLFGSDPFVDLVIHDEHRRLRVEQELRDVRIRLRRLVVDSAFDDARLGAGVDHMVKQIRSPLASLLKLHGVTSNDDLVTVLDLIGSRLKVDTIPLTQKAATSVPAAAGLAVVLDAAIDDVDALDTARVKP